RILNPIQDLEALPKGAIERLEKARTRGKFVKASRKVARILMSEAYSSHVINALAKPIDGRGAILSSESHLIESLTPRIVLRHFVYVPLQVGLIAC
ncbi:unnamed protein product, partial [Dovyalis caffra]